MPIIKNSTDTSIDIMVTGDISDDRWRYWDDFDTYPSEIKELLDDANGKDVNVHINSGGGDVFAGFMIHNLLKQYSGKTIAYIDGLSASSASIIAFGCKEIRIPSNAFLMIHKPTTGCYGNVDDFTKTIETLDVIQKGIVESYMGKVNDGVTRDKVTELVDNETWFTGTDAKEYFNVTVLDAVEVDNVVSVDSHIKIPDSVKNTLESWKKQTNNSHKTKKDTKKAIKNTVNNDIETEKLNKIKAIKIKAIENIAKNKLK